MKKWAIGIGVAGLAAYVPVWWWLTFTGYYDDKMTTEMVRNAKTFLPADLFLAANLLVLLAGIRKKRPWAYASGLIVSGAILYIGIHGATAMWTGALPHDIATQLIFWPYVVGALVGWVLLYRDLRPGFSATLNGK